MKLKRSLRPIVLLLSATAILAVFAAWLGTRSAPETAAPTVAALPQALDAQPAAPPAQAVSLEEHAALRAQVERLSAEVAILAASLEQLQSTNREDSGRAPVLDSGGVSRPPLDAFELATLRELGQARDVILHVVEEAEPEYRWKLKQARVRAAAEDLAASYGVARPGMLASFLEDLSLRKLMLDRKKRDALDKHGATEDQALAEWESGWRSLEKHAEDRLTRSGLCNSGAVGPLAMDSLRACLEFSREQP